MNRLPRPSRVPRPRGRRITDPAGLPRPTPGTQAVRGRLAAISVRAALSAGAWVGLALALGFGVVLGAGLVWLAGAVLDWQRDLAFTFGVAQRLLPFGDQQALLRNVQASWYVVIPAVGLTVALFGGLLGALIGGLLAATYNRSPRHAMIIVELPEAATQEVAPTSAADGGSVADDGSVADGGSTADGGSAADGEEANEERLSETTSNEAGTGAGG